MRWPVLSVAGVCWGVCGGLQKRAAQVVGVPGRMGGCGRRGHGGWRRAPPRVPRWLVCVSVGIQGVLAGRGDFWVFQNPARIPQSQRPANGRTTGILGRGTLAFVLCQSHEPRPVLAVTVGPNVQPFLCCVELVLTDTRRLPGQVNIDGPDGPVGEQRRQPGHRVVVPAAVALLGVVVGQVLGSRPGRLTERGSWLRPGDHLEDSPANGTRSITDLPSASGCRRWSACAWR
jgi:hypothetical protein